MGFKWSKQIPTHPYTTGNQRNWRWHQETKNNKTNWHKKDSLWCGKGTTQQADICKKCTIRYRYQSWARQGTQQPLCSLRAELPDKPACSSAARGLSERWATLAVSPAEVLLLHSWRDTGVPRSYWGPQRNPLKHQANSTEIRLLFLSTVPAKQGPTSPQFYRLFPGQKIRQH